MPIRLSVAGLRCFRISKIVLSYEKTAQKRALTPFLFLLSGEYIFFIDVKVW